MANDYSWWTFVKKCWEFLKWFFSFFGGRKEQKFNQITDNIKNGYDKIDKETDAKKEDNVKDRLNNMFKP